LLHLLLLSLVVVLCLRPAILSLLTTNHCAYCLHLFNLFHKLDGKMPSPFSSNKSVTLYNKHIFLRFILHLHQFSPPTSIFFFSPTASSIHHGFVFSTSRSWFTNISRRRPCLKSPPAGSTSFVRCILLCVSSPRPPRNRHISLRIDIMSLMLCANHSTVGSNHFFFLSAHTSPYFL